MFCIILKTQICIYVDNPLFLFCKVEVAIFFIHNIVQSKNCVSNVLLSVAKRVEKNAYYRITSKTSEETYRCIAAQLQLKVNHNQKIILIKEAVINFKNQDLRNSVYPIVTSVYFKSRSKAQIYQKKKKRFIRTIIVVFRILAEL